MSNTTLRPANEARLFRALAREGLHVSHLLINDEAGVYTIRVKSEPGAPPVEVLLPTSLPLEAKAVHQLASLASVYHPHGPRPCRICATPDFHPGDAGVPIGSVVETPAGPEGMVIPAAVGTDINCGMRLHVVDLSIDRFLAEKASFVEKMKGDYLLGTRDVAMTPASMGEMFAHGLPAWAEATRKRPLGRMGRIDWAQVHAEATTTPLQDAAGQPIPRIFAQGALSGSLDWAPPGFVPEDGTPVRDEGLATIGRGNHFVEVQVIEEVMDRRLAFAWGVRAGQVAFMIHSGSRSVGLSIGKRWEEKARIAWPKGEKYPSTGIFPLFAGTEAYHQYLTAEATAANYGFVNRALLADLFRLRLREVYGPDLEAPLVYDLPHNITLPENGRLVARKGACPAYAGQPVIIPGSMGAASFLCVGLGNDRFLSSASHGAGRSQARGQMGRAIKSADHARALGLEGVECITLREERRVEEAPSAYKPIQPVIDAQVSAGTIGVVARMRPILTFKA